MLDPSLCYACWDYCHALFTSLRFLSLLLFCFKGLCLIKPFGFVPPAPSFLSSLPPAHFKRGSFIQVGRLFREANSRPQSWALPKPGP